MQLPQAQFAYEAPDKKANKKQNTTLTVQRDSTAVVLGESKKQNTVLVTKNEEWAFCFLHVVWRTH